ncbi:phage tail protein [Roseicella sp. DB1501]|nr:phage tail protein [Roseicella sp. DB1501]
MSNTRRVAGVASFTIDGSPYMLVDGFVWSPSTVSRETSLGLDGLHGFKEMPVAGWIEANIRDSGVRVEDFNAMTSSTVVGTMANGKQVIMSLGWCTSALEVDGTEGTVKVRFEGPDVTEVFS